LLVPLDGQDRKRGQPADGVVEVSDRLADLERADPARQRPKDGVRLDLGQGLPGAPVRSCTVTTTK